MEKQCTTCKQHLPLGRFGKWKYAKDGLRPICKECQQITRRDKRLQQGLSVRKQRPEAPQGQKWCHKCEQLRAIENFGPNVNAADGLSYWCRDCRASHEDERRRSLGISATKRRAPELLQKGLKQCFGKCGRLLPVADFSPGVRGYGGLSAWCKQCMSQHRKDNSNKHTAYVRQYRKDNPIYLFMHRAYERKRKAKKKGLDTGLVTRAFLEQLYAEKTCAYCQKEVPENERTMDHVMATSRNGLHHPDNLVMACRSCNSRKGALTGAEFRQKLENNNALRSQDTG